MKDKKRRFETFTFYDHTGIETHLKHMAEQGWLLEKVGPFFWTYRRIEPKALTFSVCYFPQASQFDPEPPEGQRTFYDFCEHTGWTLAAASAQMQVFYNEQENPVPIETDPMLEMDAIHQSAKKGYLFSQFLLLGVALMNGGMLAYQLKNNPILVLSNALSLFSMLCWPILILLTAGDIAAYYLWRSRARKAAEQGEFLDTKSYPGVQKALLFVVVAGFAWGLSYMGGALAANAVLSVICTFVSIFVVCGVREWLKRKKVPAGTNRVVTFTLCIVLPLLVVVLGTVALLRTGAGGWDSSRNDNLPLTVADLVEDLADGKLDQDVRLAQSPLLAVLNVWQYLWLGRNAGDPAPRCLNYTAIQVKAEALYALCRDDLLGKENDGVPEGWKGYYEPVDPAPWGAAEAYRHFYQDTGAQNKYLLCYPGCIVEIDFDWEPTPEQMAVVGERLGG